MIRSKEKEGRRAWKVFLWGVEGSPSSYIQIPHPQFQNPKSSENKERFGSIRQKNLTRTDMQLFMVSVCHTLNEYSNVTLKKY